MDASKYTKTLLLAVENEVEAYEFYKNAATKTADANLKSIFNELAGEELKHKVILESFINNNSKPLEFNDVQDYKISESVELPKLTTSMKYTDGIALAMKKEEEAMNMYNCFAEASTNNDQKETFLQLAKMEKGHKVKLEELYANTAYTEVW